MGNTSGAYMSLGALIGKQEEVKDIKESLKEGIKRQLRILDEQNAIHRYKWNNLPEGLYGELIEKILYYRGKGCLFYEPIVNQYFFLPYALKGNVDVYGRYINISPQIFRGNKIDDERDFRSGKTYAPVYNIKEGDEYSNTENCVLLFDYSNVDAEEILPRKALQECILDAMSEAIPMARTSLLANCGVRGVRVQDKASAEAVLNASKSIEKNALNGNPLIPIQSALEIQEITGGAPLKSEEYLLYLQALDNYRMSLYGISTGGLFQKKSHMLEAEEERNASTSKLVYQDGLLERQRFAEIANKVFGLSISVEELEQEELGICEEGEQEEQEEEFVEGEE